MVRSREEECSGLEQLEIKLSDSSFVNNIVCLRSVNLHVHMAV